MLNRLTEGWAIIVLGFLTYVERFHIVVLIGNSALHYFNFPPINIRWYSVTIWGEGGSNNITFYMKVKSDHRSKFPI